MDQKFHETPPPYDTHRQPPQPGYPPHTQSPMMMSPPPMVVQAPPQSPYVTNVNISTNEQFRGSCPVCRQGNFSSGFTLCGWLCCIFCFPCGIICCLCMRKKKCNNCGWSAS